MGEGGSLNERTTSRNRSQGSCLFIYSSAAALSTEPGPSEITRRFLRPLEEQRYRSERAGGTEKKERS